MQRSRWHPKTLAHVTNHSNTANSPAHNNDDTQQQLTRLFGTAWRPLRSGRLFVAVAGRRRGESSHAKPEEAQWQGRRGGQSAEGGNSVRKTDLTSTDNCLCHRRPYTTICISCELWVQLACVRQTFVVRIIHVVTWSRCPPTPTKTPHTAQNVKCSVQINKCSKYGERPIDEILRVDLWVHGLYETAAAVSAFPRL